jgi:hypothetical protein
MRLIQLAPLTVLVAIACDARTDSSVPALAAPRAVAVPAAPGAGQPNVTALQDGRALLTWIEPADTGHALRFAIWDGDGWTAPRTIGHGADWFVNWADFPAAVEFAPGRLAAHWLQRSGPGRFSYDVMLTRSDDGGATWSAPVRPHRDGTETEHGFVSLFPHDDGVGIVWLDGRHFAADAHSDPTNEMALRVTTMHADGRLGPETVLDDRTCDCCQTAVARTGRGPVILYRDRSADEVRDIAAVRLVDGAWTRPQPVHHDGWVISGCPVNGPAADAEGDDVVVAWFTAADGTPLVNVAFSSDAGASFGAPVRVDDGDPAGRVDVLLLSRDRALVVWIENVGEDAELRGRMVSRTGRAGPARALAATTAQRASGFPRMARQGSDVLLGWTEPGQPATVRAAVLALPR